MEERPLPPGVEAAAILLGTGVDRIRAGRKIEVLPVAVGLIGLHARAADRAHEQTRGGQGRIADELGIHAPGRLAGQFAVGRVGGDPLGRGRGRLSVGGAAHDRADHVLHVPPRVDELAGQPVEQFRMHRRFPLAAEIVEHPRQPRAEELLPEPVHHHPRGERVIAGHEPPGEVEAVGRAVGDRRGGQIAGEGRLHDLPALVHPVAAGQDADDVRGFPAAADKALGKRGEERGPFLLGRVHHRLGGGQDVRGVEPGHDALKPALGGGQRGVEGGQLFQVLRGCDQGPVAASSDRGFVDVGEEGAQRVEVAHRDRVELVVVAGGAAGGLAEPHGAHGPDAVGEHPRLVVLRLGTPFLGCQQESIECRRDPRLLARVREEIAGQLLDREPVEGLVVVEASDHVVAVRPHVPRGVAVVADRIGEPHDVEPADRHPLTVVRVGKHPLHEPAIGVGSRIAHEGIDLLRRRRQAGEVEGEPADERAPVGLGGGPEAERRQPLADHVVDRMGPRRHGRFYRGLVGPVLLVRGAFVDPASEQRLLRRSERLVRLRRRHHEFGSGGPDPLDERAAGRLAGHDGAGRHGRLAVVKPQVGLPMTGVGSMAVKTVVRQERPDVAVEGHGRGGPLVCEGDAAESQAQGDCPRAGGAGGHRMLLWTIPIPICRRGGGHLAWRGPRGPIRGFLPLSSCIGTLAGASGEHRCRLNRRGAAVRSRRRFAAAAHAHESSCLAWRRTAAGPMP